MFVIIYPLEYEHELSLGMLIRPKRIYNFCLLHDYLGDIAICFATLSYLFQHIWTNLLTQCTQCQFLTANVCELQVYTHIYNARKIPYEYIKNQCSRRLLKPEGEPEGATPPPPHRRPVGT